jgi:diadenosine tetraphosphate (Ap4A) HIT family hydrolase
MSFRKHIPENKKVFREHLSHLSRERMQELKNFGALIDRVAENIEDDIFARDFTQLIYRLSVYNFLHLYF